MDGGNEEYENVTSWSPAGDESIKESPVPPPANKQTDFRPRSLDRPNLAT